MPTKNTQQNVQPEITGPEEVIQTVQAMSEAEAANVTAHPTARRGFKRFGQRDATVPKVAAAKVQLLQDARKAFSEAAQLADKGDDQEAKAVEISNRGGLMLYTGLASGIVSRAEVTAILGDEFGWKGKGNKVGQRVTSAEPDATRGTTPYGLGNQLRQRIVRAHNAHLFVSGREDDAGAFFDGLTPDIVQPIVNEYTGEDGSLWALYKHLAEAKSNATGVRPKDAFNPKKIAAIVATLGENMERTVEMFGNASLFNAYDSLYRMLGEIDRQLPEETSEAA